MAKKSIGLHFSESDEWEGFNDGDIEHFVGAPFETLGREVAQNAMDAKNKSPAKLAVRLLEVPIAELPDLDTYRDIVTRCQKGCHSEKEKLFFQQAAELLAKPKLKILQFADSNTTGVKGPCTPLEPYYVLMKSIGQSSKGSDAGSIGSFGIGKYAPYASSRLRTVFVSTVWQDDASNFHHYAQGRTRFMSHYDDKNVIRRGHGYWGQIDGRMPVEQLSALPGWLKRCGTEAELQNSVGTTISILGFDGTKGWREMIAASIAENFFGAIAGGLLEVDVDGQFTLQKDTINNFFENTAVVEAITDGEMRGQPEKFQHSGLFLEAMSITNAGVVVAQTEDANLGRCELRLLVREKLPKRVAVLRDGMLITEEMDRLKRFPDFKDFVAVLECKSEKGNELLKAMEPPNHNEFSPERLPTSKQRTAGRVALKEIAGWVRAKLKLHAQDPVSNVSNIDELKDFFADEDTATGNGRDGEENPAGKIIVRARPLPKTDKPKAWHAELSSGLDEGTDGEEDTSSGPKGSANESDSEKDLDGNGSSNVEKTASQGFNSQITNEHTSNTRVSLTNCRAITIGPRGRRLGFTPDQSGEIRLLVQDSGADSNQMLSIAKSSVGTVHTGIITDIKVNAGERYILDVEFDTDFPGTIRMVADAV